MAQHLHTKAILHTFWCKDTAASFFHHGVFCMAVLLSCVFVIIIGKSHGYVHSATAHQKGGKPLTHIPVKAESYATWHLIAQIRDQVLW
jgi:hypothetical protein